MSKNIIVQEGGIGKQLTADKLKTNLVGGGTCLWVPEDETNLGTKYISENGTYKASDDGYDGYSEVTVSGVGSVTGRDPQTGNDENVEVDPETGDLVITVLPSEIKVITPPTNPYGTYIDGQTITTDGMVVKAYDNNNHELQVVPNSEITLTPTVAVYDESKDTRGTGEATSDLETVLAQPIGYSAEAKHQLYSSTTGNLIFEEGWNTGAIAAYEAAAPTIITVLIASASQPIVRTIHESIGTESERTRTVNENVSTFTYDGKTVYYCTQTINNNPANGWKAIHGAINSKGAGVPGGNDAWTMVYGTRKDNPAGSPQTITVSWPRPGDGKVLETTFEILVAPGYGGDEGENGNAGTPPPGMLIP